MPLDRFLIAPINSGLQRDLRPWLIPDDAFQALENVYVFRGRVRKRFGGSLTGATAPTPAIAPFYSRLSVQVGTTDGSGDISTTVSNSVYAIGQAFTIGTQVFTVVELGTPGTLQFTGAASVATFNTTTGALIINGAAINTAVFFYPGLPVMGLTTYDLKGVSINDQPAYAFDTQWAYTYNGTRWIRSGTGTTPLWHGGDANFFVAWNWRGITPDARSMFVSNYYVVNPNGAGTATDDFLWATSDGTTWVKLSGADGLYFAPAGGAPQTGPFVVTARIIIGFKDRLILLNTIENDGTAMLGVNTQYVNRARFSASISPFAQNAWYNPGQTDNAGSAAGASLWAGAGFLDAPTDEAIVTAEFIKDRLIVFFERSTWELAYTNNQSSPFQWQKINTELGAEATLSSIPFDRHVLAMGSVGVHACNGANVERIDNKIPDEVFTIRNANSGVYRVAGIRDFYAEVVYWTFPSEVLPSPFSNVFPNKVLVYNYRTGSWALNDDTITVFGYFNQELSQTWASQLSLTWTEAGFNWGSATDQSQFRAVIAGNQQGFVFICDTDIDRNAPVLQIIQMGNVSMLDGIMQATIINHNLTVGDTIAIENAFNTLGALGLPSPLMVTILSVTDANTVTFYDPINYTPYTGTYAAGGSATYVSNIGIISKQFNPYVEEGRDVYVQKVDFAVKRTSGGQITVDYLTSSADLSMLQEAQDTGTILGNSVLETTAYVDVPFEMLQKRLWHPIYFQSQGECIQLFLYFSIAQISQPIIAWAPFELEAMLLHTERTSNRLQ